MSNQNKSDDKWKWLERIRDIFIIVGVILSVITIYITRIQFLNEVDFNSRIEEVSFIIEFLNLSEDNKSQLILYRTMTKNEEDKYEKLVELIDEMNNERDNIERELQTYKKPELDSEIELLFTDLFSDDYENMNIAYENLKALFQDDPKIEYIQMIFHKIESDPLNSKSRYNSLLLIKDINNIEFLKLEAKYIKRGLEFVELSAKEGNAYKISPETQEIIDKIKSNIEDALEPPKKVKKEDKYLSLKSSALKKHRKGEYKEAIDGFNEFLIKAQKRKDKFHQAYAIFYIAKSYHEIGKYELAKQKYLDSLEIFSELGKDRWVSHVKNNLGMIYKEEGRYAEALECYKTAIELQGENKWKAYSYERLGDLYLYKLYNINNALENYRHACNLYEKLNMTKDKNELKALMSEIEEKK